MQTNFTLAQLADHETARSEHILRKCVHCGFCTATCPTFVLLGDERDSPRGRIYLIKAMLEGDRAPTTQEVRHVDRCLSCLSCMTTCPSGVNYMHLVDHGRHRIEESYKRPLPDRLMRNVLAWLMPRPGLFRWAMILGRLAKPLAPILPAKSSDAGGATFLRRLRAMLEAVAGPARAAGRCGPAAGLRRPRALRRNAGGDAVRLAVSRCWRRRVNEATVRLLTRLDMRGGECRQGCRGAAVPRCPMSWSQRGGPGAGLRQGAISTAWLRAIDGAGLDAIVVNASGCGTTVKDYGHMLARPSRNGRRRRLQVARPWPRT
jgi:glycolate oxidase iron-sulfur subunit